MNDGLPDDLRAVADFFGLADVAVVEKDWHVIQALAAIAAIDASPFRLVFAGGTALSRAFRVVRRMSEDIDLKIIAEDRPSRPALRKLRETVTDALLGAGFAFDPANPQHRHSGNESRYTIFRLPYARVGAAPAHLRPEIQIELGVWPLRHPTVERPVTSFVAEALQRQPEVSAIECVSITQTAAEKFVALTRRVAVEIAGAREHDPTLVRHIYDLHVLRPHYDVAEVATLVREVMAHDAEEFGNQFPAYRADPMAQTRRAIEALHADPHYTNAYGAFCRGMVYGEQTDYATALAALAQIRDLMPADGTHH